MYELGYSRTLAQSKIVDIVFESFNISINKGKKIEEYWKRHFNEVKFEDHLIYCIKQWQPIYVLETGERIEYSHKLYHVKKD